MSHVEVIVKYNSSTGSDTNPSDASGSSVTTSTTASGTGATTTITFSSAVDLTGTNGVADDDTDYIWVASNSGNIHLFQITAFNPSTSACTSVTIAQAVEADFSGSAWHVNGTRRSFESDTSNSDFEDMDRGWTFELDGSFTMSTRWLRLAQNLPYRQALVDDPPIQLRASASASARPKIDMQQNRELLRWSGEKIVRVTGLELTCSTGGGANSRIYVAGGSLTMVDCVITTPGGSAVSMIDAGSGDSVTFHDCYIKGGSTYVLEDDAASYFAISNCVIDCDDTHGTTAAIKLSATNCNILVDTLITEAAGIGVQLDVTGNAGRQSMWFVKNVTVVDCAGDGFELSGTPNATTNPAWSINVVNCLSVNNGGYGFDLDDTYMHGEAGYRDYNCAFNNTSGSYNGMPAGPNDITITVDPFTDAANDDYTLNNTTGGGASLRDAALYDLPDGT